VKENPIITEHDEFRMLKEAGKCEKKTYGNGDGREY